MRPRLAGLSPRHDGKDALWGRLGRACPRDERKDALGTGQRVAIGQERSEDEKQGSKPADAQAHSRSDGPRWVLSDRPLPWKVNDPASVRMATKRRRCVRTGLQASAAHGSAFIRFCSKIYQEIVYSFGRSAGWFTTVLFGSPVRQVPPVDLIAHVLAARVGRQRPIKIKQRLVGFSKMDARVEPGHDEWIIRPSNATARDIFTQKILPRQSRAKAYVSVRMHLLHANVWMSTRSPSYAGSTSFNGI